MRITILNFQISSPELRNNIAQIRKPSALIPKLEIRTLLSTGRKHFVQRPPENKHPDFGVLMDETRFWVVHRRELYGPFDYQWSIDLRGIEFLYQHNKYGECCSNEEFFADLKRFQLPRKVSQVATIVTGTVVSCIFRCITSDDRVQQITQNLRKMGLERYILEIRREPSG